VHERRALRFPKMKLTQQQLQDFDTNGYLVIPDFFDPSELKAQAQVLLDNFDPIQHQKTIFTTDDDNHVGNDYFLQSGDKIRYFLEDSNKLEQDPKATVNKIGHCLHELGL
jgi:phytanoyl-CoA hydroxylase